MRYGKQIIDLRTPEELEKYDPQALKKPEVPAQPKRVRKQSEIDRIEALTKPYMTYKDIAVAFSVCPTIASKIKKKVCLTNPKAVCPFSTELVKTPAVFEALGLDFNEYIETIKKVQEIM
jgi:hypothetical protein